MGIPMTPLLDSDAMAPGAGKSSGARAVSRRTGSGPVSAPVVRSPFGTRQHMSLLLAAILVFTALLQVLNQREGRGETARAGSAPGAALSGVRVVDLHVDLAYALHTRRHGIAGPAAPLSPDRVLRGGVGTLVVPLFVESAHRLTPARARDAYDATLASLESALRSDAARGVFGPVGAGEVGDRVAVVLAFEGADGFADEPTKIVPWIRRGACLVGLVHGRTNALAGSSTEPKRERRNLGLTERGRALAEVVIRHGGVLDAAHASDAAMDDLVRLAKASAAPLVVTHTGLRSLCPIDRNLDDARLSAIAETGGVVGIDLHRGHLVAGSSRPATVDDVIAHLEHAVSVAGVEHVAIGSDFDGGIRPPRGVNGADFWSLLADRLAARGWTHRNIAAVLQDNAARVLTWARQHGCGSG